MKFFYMLFGGAVLMGYAAHGALGWEMTSASQRIVVPAEVRRSPGGYRSYHFWYSGTHWGK